MIEVKNLVKDYGGRLAVDHLSFTVEDGQIYGCLLYTSISITSSTV